MSSGWIHHSFSLCLLLAAACTRPPTAAPGGGEAPAEPSAAPHPLAAPCRALENEAERLTEQRIQTMGAFLVESFAHWKEEHARCDERADVHAHRSLPGPIGMEPDFGRAPGFGSGHGRLGGDARASSTNNQVAAVDEADLVKHDGRYLYLAVNRALSIVTARDPLLLSVTSLPGAARELFVDGDRAVVFVAQNGGPDRRCHYGYDCRFVGDGSRTKILVFDIADRIRPRVVRELTLSGSLLTARRIGTTIHAVVTDRMPPPPELSWWPRDLSCDLSETEVRAQFAALAQENERLIRAASSLPIPTLTENGQARALCEITVTGPLAEGEAYTTVVSFELSAWPGPATTATVLSHPGPAYASAGGLYLAAEPARLHGHQWYALDLSDVHKFRIGSAPELTRYVGSGVVPGRVLNQLSMDERHGYLRVASTVGRVPNPEARNVVSILTESPSGDLVRVGALADLARGEDIRAVRFDEDHAYLVTFKKTDPLFVLDLRQPEEPRVLGELKIPGFSTYLHRITPTHLLSIGYDASDQGRFAYFDGVLLQLFDVQNLQRPRLLFRGKIGSRGSSSQALTDHLAFNYLGERGLLALPMTVCDGGGAGRFGQTLGFSGLLVYQVSATGGFRSLGRIAHGGAGQHCHAWWSQATSEVKRSVFVDDLVFSIARSRIKVQRLGALGRDLADITL